MVMTRRIWVGAATTALACALLVGTATAGRARSKAKRARSAAAKTEPARPKLAAPVSPVEVDAPLGARVHAAWVFYRSLAEWQLRSQLSPASYGQARRALSLAVGLASASPASAVAAALHLG